MPRAKRSVEPQRQQAPAKTFESRENQMIAYAVDLAEKQLREGTASSQVIAHYLKLGSTRERAEKEKLAKEIELLTAKTESIKSAKNSEELYAKALLAMSRYAGQDAESGDLNEPDER